MKFFHDQSPRNSIIAGTLIVLLILAAASMAIAEKSKSKGYLGVYIEKFSKEEQKDLGVSNGVLITGVIEDGPAEKAGLMEDDVILTFHGKKIDDPDDLINAVRETRPSTEAVLTVLRDGKKMDVTVTVGKYRSAISLRFRPKAKGRVMTLSIGGGGYLGVRLQDMNKDLAGYFGVQDDGGALIIEVMEDTPAMEAGLKSGDVITKIDDEPINSPEDAREVLADYEEGDEVEVTLIRHKNQKKVKVELDEVSSLSNIIIKSRVLDDDSWDIKHFHLNIPEIDDIDIPTFEYDFEIHKDLENLEKRIQKRIKSVDAKVRRSLERVEEKVHKNLRVLEETSVI
jgi:C-terminal processing protease CtpA/Prc